MVTGRDRGNLSIKSALLSVQVNQTAGEATGFDRLSQESGQPLLAIWVTSTSPVLGVVHITLSTIHCYN